MYVYKIVNNVNGKMYIGITARSIELRYDQHLYSKKEYPLYRAFDKYGRDNFTIELLDCCETREEATSLEKYYIKLYNSTNGKFGYNQTAGGEDNCGSSNPRASLTDEEVLAIRKLRFSSTTRCKTAHKQYRNKISYSAFEKIWEGQTWTHLGKEYLNAPINTSHKANNGESNGNAVYTDNEVLEIRKFYTTHTLEEVYNKFGSRSASKDSFRSVIANSYKHLPIYSKIKKCWLLNKEIINIQEYTNPVSTISVSGE